MRFLIPFVIGVIAICGGCSSSPSGPSESGTSAKNNETSSALNPRTGTSFDTAIVIDAKNEMDGVPAEYRWLKQNLKGYKPEGQSATAQGGHMYDIIRVKNESGKKREVYFDTTSFFGKL